MAPPSSDRVGFAGLGIMGSRQAANLARAGYELTVFNRTRSKGDDWIAEHGGQVADSPVDSRCDSVPRRHGGGAAWRVTTALGISAQELETIEAQVKIDPPTQRRSS